MFHPDYLHNGFMATSAIWYRMWICLRMFNIEPVFNSEEQTG